MDDDSLVRRLISKYLTVFGYEVVAVAEGQEAVAAFAEQRALGRPFAAVILDLTVRVGWGGERTLHELLKMDPGVKALVCSGTLEEPAAHYRKQGFFGVLEKPFSQTQLHELVEVAVHSAGPC